MECRLSGATSATQKLQLTATKLDALCAEQAREDAIGEVGWILSKDGLCRPHARREPRQIGSANRQPKCGNSGLSANQCPL